MFGSKKAKKPKSTAQKVIDWVITGIIASVMVGFATVFIISKANNNQSPFGPTYQKVLTDSMSPTYKVNDIIVVEKTNPAKLKERFDRGENVDVSFRVKDIVEPRNLINNFKRNDVSMTHRIMDVSYSEEAQIDAVTGLEYHYTFVTHGINKESEFCKIGDQYGDCTTQTQKFHEDALIGRVTRKSGFMSFATSVWGLLVLLLIPCMYLITYSVIDICRALDDKDEENPEGGAPGNKDPLAGLSEKEKEKLKKQMLDEMLGKK